ncbi:MAG: S1 RNA-binding domain-containing protein [Patescibacteria group bacterium]
MKNIIENNNDIKPLRVGQIVQGEIVGTERSSLFLDISPFGTGIIYGREFYNAKEVLRKMNKGDVISAKIIDFDNEDGYIDLSISSASQEMAWEDLKKKKETQELITVKITGANRGGLLAQMGGIQAFLPVSQLGNENYPRVEGADSNKILVALQKFIGQEMSVKIFDLSQRDEKLILSEKANESKKIEEALTGYNVDQVVKATVTGTTDFGVFVSFGEEQTLEGLIHISELDWAIVENPSDIVKVGEKIEAKIIEISNNKVFLSLKSLKKDPWDGVEKEYEKGGKIKGTVVKFNPFGAFIQIQDKIQGLIHISEFGNQDKMKEKIEINKEYNFKILSIEPKEHKITLSLEE